MSLWLAGAVLGCAVLWCSLQTGGWRAPLPGAHFLPPFLPPPPTRRAFRERMMGAPDKAGNPAYASYRCPGWSCEPLLLVRRGLAALKVLWSLDVDSESVAERAVRWTGTRPLLLLPLAAVCTCRGSGASGQ